MASKISKKKINLPIDFIHLNKGINNIILDKLHKLKGSCSKEDGYIVDIKNDINIIDNVISRATNKIIFEIEYYIEHIIPEKGIEIECEVCLIFNYGILVNYKKNIKILIPNKYLTEYKYDEGSFIKGKYIINKGDIIKVKLLDFKYENREYSCIGKLI